MSLVTLFMPSAGIASATSSPPASTSEMPGRRMTRPVSGGPEAGLARRAAPAAENRDPALLHSVSEPAEHRGSTVSDANIAIATTRIVPLANEMNVLSPLMNMPAIATITVTPEIRTARPDVAAAASSAAVSLRPAARSSRSRLR